jgi:hypothetical protein
MMPPSTPSASLAVCTSGLPSAVPAHMPSTFGHALLWVSPSASDLHFGIVPCLCISTLQMGIRHKSSPWLCPVR